MVEVRVGCSGWSYKDWNGPFYAPDTQPGKMLTEYVRSFDTVEVNSTFYRLPNEWMVRGWVKRTPPDFRFSAKMTREVTHEREMRSVKPAYDRFMTALLPLKPKIGSILIQMPQRFRANESNYALLEDFLSMLHTNVQFTAEFRDRSWFDERTFNLLERYNVAFCVVSQPQLKGLIPPEPIVTADHAYVRFHGLNYKNWYSGKGSARYDYLYSKEELEEWKPKIEQMEDRATKTIYVYFNNHPSGQAPTNARMMTEILGITPKIPKGLTEGTSKQKTL